MINYKNIQWKNYHGALIPNIAPHIDIKLSQKDKKYLLNKTNAYFLRYPTNWDTNTETEFWYIIKDSQEDLMNYKSNHRNQIKKGLKNCIIKKVSSLEVAQNGYECYANAMKRYNTSLNIISKKEFFDNKVNASSRYDFFAVYENTTNKMISWSSNILSCNSVNYTEIKSDPNYLKLYPSYALFFEMNKYYLNEKKYLYVNDGARSISHDTNIQEFLIQKFNFRKAYCRLNIIYRWDIGVIVGLLYPFRSLVAKFKDKKVFNKLNTLLIQEKIRRDCAFI